MHRFVDRSELAGRMRYLYETGEGTDVELIVEDEDDNVAPARGARFLAHRSVLLTASAPMRMLLMQASSVPPVMTPSPVAGWPATPLYSARVRGVSPDGFAALLAYVYCGAVPLEERQVVELFLAADRFDLGAVRRRAELYLPRALTVRGAAALLIRACKAKQLQLVAYVSAFIARHFDSFIETAGFLALPQSLLRALLSSPNVTVASENAVFLALVRWVLHRMQVGPPRAAAQAAAAAGALPTGPAAPGTAGSGPAPRAAVGANHNLSASAAAVAVSLASGGSTFDTDGHSVSVSDASASAMRMGPAGSASASAAGGSSQGHRAGAAAAAASRRLTENAFSSSGRLGESSSPSSPPQQQQQQSQPRGFTHAAIMMSAAAAGGGGGGGAGSTSGAVRFLAPEETDDAYAYADAGRSGGGSGFIARLQAEAADRDRDRERERFAATRTGLALSELAAVPPRSPLERYLSSRAKERRRSGDFTSPASPGQGHEAADGSSRDTRSYWGAGSGAGEGGASPSASRGGVTRHGTSAAHSTSAASASAHRMTADGPTSRPGAAFDRPANMLSGAAAAAAAASLYAVNDFIASPAALPGAYAVDPDVPPFSTAPGLVFGGLGAADAAGAAAGAGAGFSLADARLLFAPFLSVLLLESLSPALLRSPLLRALVPGEMVLRALFTKVESSDPLAGMPALAALGLAPPSGPGSFDMRFGVSADGLGGPASASAAAAAFAASTGAGARAGAGNARGSAALGASANPAAYSFLAEAGVRRHDFAATLPTPLAGGSSGSALGGSSYAIGGAGAGAGAGTGSSAFSFYYDHDAQRMGPGSPHAASASAMGMGQGQEHGGLSGSWSGLPSAYSHGLSAVPSSSVDPLAQAQAQARSMAAGYGPRPPPLAGDGYGEASSFSDAQAGAWAAAAAGSHAAGVAYAGVGAAPLQPGLHATAAYGHHHQHQQQNYQGMASYPGAGGASGYGASGGGSSYGGSSFAMGYSGYGSGAMVADDWHNTQAVAAAAAVATGAAPLFAATAAAEAASKGSTARNAGSTSDPWSSLLAVVANQSYSFLPPHLRAGAAAQAAAELASGTGPTAALAAAALGSLGGLGELTAHGAVRGAGLPAALLALAGSAAEAGRSGGGSAGDGGPFAAFGPLAGPLEILASRGQLAGLAPLAVPGRKPPTRRFADISVHPGGKAAVGDAAVARAAAALASPAAGTGAGSVPMPPVRPEDGYGLYDLSERQAAAAAAAAAAASGSGGSAGSPVSFSSSLSSPLSALGVGGHASAHQASSLPGDAETNLLGLPRGTGLVGSLALVSPATVRFDSYPATDAELSNGARTIKSRGHVRTIKQRVGHVVWDGEGDGEDAASSGSAGVYATAQAQMRRGVWGEPPQPPDAVALALQAMNTAAAVAASASSGSSSASARALLAGAGVSLSSGSASASGTASAAASAAAVSSTGLRAAELPNPARLDPDAGAPIAGVARAGFTATALPAVAVPVQESKSGRRRSSSLLSGQGVGVAGSGLGLGPSAPNPLSDAAPLGYGVLPAGRWAWALVVEAADALFDPLDNAFTRFGELARAQAKAKTAAQAAAVAAAQDAAAATAAATASLMGYGYGSSAASLSPIPTRAAGRMSVSLRPAAAGAAAAAVAASLGLAGSFTGPAPASASGAAASAGGAGAGPASASIAGSGAGAGAGGAAPLYRAPSLHAFELAIALIPAGVASHPSALRGSNPEALEAMFMLTNRGHLFIRVVNESSLDDAYDRLGRGMGMAGPSDGSSGSGDTRLGATSTLREEDETDEHDDEDGPHALASKRGGGDHGHGHEHDRPRKALEPLSLVASGLCFGVASHVIVAVDSAAGHVGVSISNTRPLSGVSAAEQAGRLAGSVAELTSVTSGAGGGGPALEAVHLAALLDGGLPDAGPGSVRRVDPCTLGASSQLCPAHNSHHPFHLPADVDTRVEAAGVASMSTPDPLSGEGACLHAAVMSLQLSSLFTRLRGQRRLQSGVSALQLALLVRDGEGLSVTLLPPPLMSSRDTY